MSHSQVWIHLKNIYMQLHHGLMNIFLMKKEYQRIEVSHYLQKSERSINESPCPDTELLAVWCRVSTNRRSKAPTWLLPSGRAWGCRWVSGLWRRGLPQGRLKAWLQSCQTWQRRPGLLPSVEAPPPLLLSRGGDPLGMEHSTDTDTMANVTETNRRAEITVLNKATRTHWVSYNPPVKSSTFLFSCLQHTNNISMPHDKKAFKTEQSSITVANYHSSLLASAWTPLLHWHGSQCPPQTLSGTPGYTGPAEGLQVSASRYTISTAPPEQHHHEQLRQKGQWRPFLQEASKTLRQ